MLLNGQGKGSESVGRLPSGCGYRHVLPEASALPRAVVGRGIR